MEYTNRQIKIRCINNKPFHPSQTIQNLTIGKIYETYDNPETILISNDVCTINDLKLFNAKI